MRQIKFKGKDIEGVWRFGSLVIDNAPMIGKQYMIVDNRVHYVIHPETVGQSTGLKDKNGKEAFLGDIIRFTDTEGRVFVKELSWSADLCCVMVGNSSYQRLHESGFIQPSVLEFELIGNIHDNPELLKD